MSVIKWLFIIPIKFYQWCISPMLPSACRFMPTCSEYCVQAIGKHGPIKGGILGAKRICKCHPWSNKDGIDPVP